MSLASFNLAVLFPVHRGLAGGSTRICDIPTGYAESKWFAVHLIIEAAFARYEARGNGNRAKKRAQRLKALSAPNVLDTSRWDRTYLAAYYDRPGGYSGD